MEQVLVIMKGQDSSNDVTEQNIED